jgi:hypothetical protein
VRTNGFALKKVFRSSVARWLPIVATASAATACSGTLSSIATKMSNVLPGPSATETPAPVPAPTPKISAELIHAGDAAREKGDLDSAATNYAAAVAVEPISVAAELRLGSVELARRIRSAHVPLTRPPRNWRRKIPRPPSAWARFR